MNKDEILEKHLNVDVSKSQYPNGYPYITEAMQEYSDQQNKELKEIVIQLQKDFVLKWDDLKKHEAIEFLNWMFDSLWTNGKSIGQSGKHWYKQYSSPDKREYKTTEELYELYLLQSKQ